MVTVYSKLNCSQCEQTIKMLNITKVPFVLKKLDQDFTMDDIDSLSKQYNESFKSFPIIFHEQKYIGGFESLKRKIVNKEITI